MSAQRSGKVTSLVDEHSSPHDLTPPWVPPTLSPLKNPETSSHPRSAESIDNSRSSQRGELPWWHGLSSRVRLMPTVDAELSHRTVGVH